MLWPGGFRMGFLTALPALLFVLDRRHVVISLLSAAGQDRSTCGSICGLACQKCFQGLLHGAEGYFWFKRSL